MLGGRLDIIQLEPDTCAFPNDYAVMDLLPLNLAPVSPTDPNVLSRSRSFEKQPCGDIAFEFVSLFAEMYFRLLGTLDLCLCEPPFNVEAYSFKCKSSWYHSGITPVLNENV